MTLNFVYIFRIFKYFFAHNYLVDLYKNLLTLFFFVPKKGSKHNGIKNIVQGVHGNCPGSRTICFIEYKVFSNKIFKLYLSCNILDEKNMSKYCLCYDCLSETRVNLQIWKNTSDGINFPSLLSQLLCFLSGRWLFFIGVP